MFLLCLFFFLYLTDIILTERKIWDMLRCVLVFLSKKK